MASSDQQSPSSSLSLRFSQTALCIIPPENLCGEINRLRSFYDQAYGGWPPHINLLYPFVAAGSVPEAVARIRTALIQRRNAAGAPNVRLRLDQAGFFVPRKGNIVHLIPRSEDASMSLTDLRDTILAALGQPDGGQFNPHLTVGQTRAGDEQSRDSLLSKVRLLPPIEWNVEELVVLVRERVIQHGQKFSQMRVWGTIGLSGDLTMNNLAISEVGHVGEHMHALHNSEMIPTQPSISRSVCGEPMTTYQFPPDGYKWTPCAPILGESGEKEPGWDTLTVSSYNVLLEQPYPPPRGRYPALVHTILAQSALADILVLQEVCDDFLSHLLSQNEIQSRYCFATHGPPHQAECAPLPMQRNVVILSRFRFSWEILPFTERYKTAVILKMVGVGKQTADSRFLPLIVAAVHLTSGLADRRVSAKESQIRALYDFLDHTYPENPCIIAGDMNIPTSALTVQSAMDEKLLSPAKAYDLSQLESLLCGSRFEDAWLMARANAKDLSPNPADMLSIDTLEGEEGATFDPRRNPLAAASAGPDGRPQRYDRILMDRSGFLGPTEFNLFGLPDDDQNPAELGSDHWGVRATFCLKLESTASDNMTVASTSASFLTPTKLFDRHSLELCLRESMMLPTEADVSKRQSVVDLLRDVITQGPAARAGDGSGNNPEPNIAMVLVPVGSYGLGVWSPSSDIDCLVIGPISSKTFFAVAEKRLRKATDLGIRILRRVKAATGTMLELEVEGIKCDLQYCPASRVVEAWQRISLLPPDDSTFYLSSQALTKLQAFRDVDYIRRSIPDLAAFRAAHRFITLWAKRRGIYLARFGYLGGIHITMMLSRVCKLSCRKGGATSMDMICRFFKYYTNFDWEREILCDPSFFKDAPRYRRYANEPMVILTIHTPLVNIARSASKASTRTIIKELQRMDELISTPDMSWSGLVGNITASDSSQEFLKTYTSYIKIHVQYWGMILAKGSTLLGWLESRCCRLLNGAYPVSMQEYGPRDSLQERVSVMLQNTKGSTLLALRETRRVILKVLRWRDVDKTRLCLIGS
ncbi:predicted protein [Uncinocarpus reesii 1704]|uniref:polynucleotide adenylyltransferase n=1 Tax=Uncinocarpus reesii (strain UAMH 1704) TaxID=336963 RepID=C4JXZ1_UNCRE|nr:uncharacterized protein UREG_07042 [Uncinocarpus reesii 1704]EEP82177.1 predicted protein [Uncinocarpus reesii 1704]